MKHLLTFIFVVLCTICLIENYKTSPTNGKTLFFYNGRLEGELKKSYAPRHPFLESHEMCKNEEPPPPILFEPNISRQPRPLQEINFEWAGSEQNNEMTKRLLKRSKNQFTPYPLLGIDSELSSMELYPPSCACQTKYELVDLGFANFPRYLLNAVCVNRSVTSVKCWRGSKCKEIPYKVRVLTQRLENEKISEDELASWLPDDLRYSWKFRTIQVSAACQCAL